MEKDRGAGGEVFLMGPSATGKNARPEIGSDFAVPDVLIAAEED